ncbi:MAG: RNA polymerase sigma factor [Bacteroidota bacterium]
MDGKQEQFMQAYQSCHARFVRYCTALAFGKMDTEDLVQDVLLSAYQHFEGIQDKEQLIHYLIRAARNRSISRWRRSAFQADLLTAHTEKLRAQGLSPEVSLDIQLLYRTLDKLPRKQREALMLFEISGFSMKEIAEIQQSTEGAIKTKISRGRKRLRELMDDGPRPVAELFKTVQSVML